MSDKDQHSDDHLLREMHDEDGGYRTASVDQSEQAEEATVTTPSIGMDVGVVIVMDDAPDAPGDSNDLKDPKPSVADADADCAHDGHDGHAKESPLWLAKGEDTNIRHAVQVHANNEQDHDHGRSAVRLSSSLDQVAAAQELFRGSDEVEQGFAQQQPPPRQAVLTVPTIQSVNNYYDPELQDRVRTLEEQTHQQQRLLLQPNQLQSTPNLANIDSPQAFDGTILVIPDQQDSNGMADARSDDTTTKRKATTPNNERRRKLPLLCILLVVIFAISLGAGIIVPRMMDKNDSFKDVQASIPVPTTAPVITEQPAITTTFPTVQPTVHQTQPPTGQPADDAAVKFASLLDLLEPTLTQGPTFTNRIALSDPSTAQNAALMWMASEDMFQPATISSSSPPARALSTDSRIESGSAERFQATLERYVVLVLYFSLNGDRWTSQHNLLSPNDSVCQWSNVPNFAILCNPQPPHTINTIDFLFNNIEGEIPNELYLLTNLEHLRLEAFRITGTLSPYVGQLAKLKLVNFYDADMSGTIPSEIGLLTELEELSISRNRFNGSLPQEMGDLENLRAIFIELNDLTGPIPEQIYGWTHLEYFRANGNDFTTPLPCGSNVEGTCETITVDLALLNEYLDLLEPILREAPTFTDRVALMDTSTPQFYALAWMVTQDSILAGGLASEDVSLLLERYALLVVYYALGGPAWLNQHSLLSPDISICDWSNVPNFVLACDNDLFPQSLTVIDFLFNNIDGVLPDELYLLTNLRYLRIEQFLVSGRLSTYIGGLTNLQLLNFYDADLTGTIPSEIGQLAELTELSISFNRLIGSLPSEMGNLAKMEAIFIDNNDLTGTIPTELNRLTNLTTFRGDGNAFTLT